MIKCALLLLIIATCIFGIFADDNSFCEAKRKLDSQCAKYCYQVAKPLLQMAPVCHQKDAEIIELTAKLSKLQRKLAVYEERERKSEDEVKLYKYLNAKFDELYKKLAENRETKSKEEINLYRRLTEKSFGEVLNERIDEENLNRMPGEQLFVPQEGIAASEDRLRKCSGEINLSQKLRDEIVEVKKMLGVCEERVKNAIKMMTIRYQKAREDLKQCNSYAKIYENCLEHVSHGVDTIDMIKIKGTKAIEVVCVNTLSSGPGWMQIQQRKNINVDFNESWYTYRGGFGSANGSFFIGLDRLYRVTNAEPHELYIDMVDWNGDTKFAHYDNFRVGSESEQYPLKDLGNYTSDSNAGDGLRHNNNMQFSTRDRDQDKLPDLSCADKYRSGWWHNNCTEANLNGHYYQVPHLNKVLDGIWWLKPGKQLKRVRMLIRPKIKK